MADRPLIIETIFAFEIVFLASTVEILALAGAALCRCLPKLLERLFSRRQIRIKLQHAKRISPGLVDLSLSAVRTAQVESDTASVRRILKRGKPQVNRRCSLVRLVLR